MDIDFENILNERKIEFTHFYQIFFLRVHLTDKVFLMYNFNSTRYYVVIVISQVIAKNNN